MHPYAIIFLSLYFPIASIDLANYIIGEIFVVYYITNRWVSSNNPNYVIISVQYVLIRKPEEPEEPGEPEEPEEPGEPEEPEVNAVMEYAKRSEEK